MELTTTDMNKIIKTSTSSFEAMRKQNTVYVDKTEYLYNLIQIEGGYFFLSRPRRFGKSLTLSTLKAIFEGRKELFDGLYIGQTDYEFKKSDYTIVRTTRSCCSSYRRVRQTAVRQHRQRTKGCRDTRCASWVL